MRVYHQDGVIFDVRVVPAGGDRVLARRGFARHGFARHGAEPRGAGAHAEQRDLPQPRQGVVGKSVAVAGIARLADRDDGRQPEQAAGRVEHQERQRQLDHHRRDDADPHVGAARVEDDVEPRVAAQQRAGDDQAGDDDLAAPPERPAGRRERGEQDQVEPDPGALPVLSVKGTVQGEDEDDDPADEHGARDDRHEHAKPPAAGQVDP